MVQQQTTQNTQMKVVALAMQILGTKNESELKTALSKMSEVGRTKFIQQCSNIIQTGDQSPESLKQAQQLAQMALEEGPEQDYAQMARHGASLRRYYFGGRVKTYDGNYMDLKKPLNKDQVEGREAIGVYKGKWMYLNSDKIAIPKPGSKAKSYDGTAHVNRAYHGMLLPKPQRYSIGGFFNKIGNGIGKGIEWMQKGSNDLNEKYGINLGKFFEDLQPLGNIYGKERQFGLLNTAANALFTNTPPAPQDVENQRQAEEVAVENGEKPGADNGSPSTPTPAPSAEDRNRQITEYLKSLGYSDDLINQTIALLNPQQQQQ